MDPRRARDPRLARTDPRLQQSQPPAGPSTTATQNAFDSAYNHQLNVPNSLSQQWTENGNVGTQNIQTAAHIQANTSSQVSTTISQSSTTSSASNGAPV